MKKILFILSSFIASNYANAQTLSQGIEALDLGNMPKAKSILGGLYTSNKTDLNNLIQMANYYALVGQNDSAIAVLNTAASIDTKSPLKSIANGKMLLLSGDKIESKKVFEKIILSTKSKDATYPLEIGYTYLAPKIKDLDEAIYFFNKSKEIDYKNPRTLMLLGDAYLIKNEGGKAMSNYEQAAAIKKTATTMYKIGNLNMQAKNYDEAIKGLEASVAIDPNFAEAYERLGECYYLNKQFNKVAVNFKKYAELNPTDAEGKLRYVNFLFLKDDFKNLKAEIPYYLSSDANNLQLNRFMGYACFEEKSYDSSVVFMNRFMELSTAQGKPAVARDYRYLGQALLKTKNDSASLINLLKAYEMDPSKTELLNDISEIYYKKKDWTNAIKFGTLKIKNDKTTETGIDVNDVYALGRAYYFSKDYINADTTFGTVISMIPTKTFGWLFKAKTKMKIELDTKNPIGLALPYYLKYIEIASIDIEKNKKDLIDAYSNLGFIYFTKKENNNAKAAYAKILELDPTNTQAKNNMEAIK